MAISVLFNGITYSIPETGEESWGEELTEYFVAIPAGALQKSGGNFTLTADVNFGANFGLLSQYYKTRTSNIATAGQFRLARADVISWRNQANGANLDLGVNASNVLTFNGGTIPTGGITALTGDVTATGPGSVAATIAANAVTDAKFRQSGALTVVGNSTNATANVADISAGTDHFVLLRRGTSLSFALLLNANIDPAAAIALTKLAALTASRAVVSDVSGFMVSATTTATEIGYVNGVTSAIQTQLDSKLTATLADGRIFVGNVSNVATAVAVTGDVTVTNAGVTAIGLNKVLDTMIRQSAGLSVVGNTTNSTANVADITAGTDNFVLRRSGTALSFGLLVNANIDAAAAIAFSKLAALNSANIMVGSAGNVATSVAVTGDVTISNAGVTAIGNAKVTNAMLATAASAATPSYVVLRDASGNLSGNNFLSGYTTTATAAVTTTLLVGSTQLQYFTGVTTQIVALPVTSTLVLGQSFTIVNNSSGAVTVNSSGGNAVVVMAANSIATVTCILTSGTSAASWNVTYSTAAAGGGSVTSVALSVPGTSIFGVSGSPVTTSGTLGLTTTGTSGGIPFFSSTSQLATSALLTASQLMIGGGAGVAPSVLAAGTNGYLLQMGASNPGYVSASSAGASMVLIGTGTASNSATIDFTSISNTTYDSYLIIGDNIVPANNGVDLVMRISVSGTFQSGAGAYDHQQWRWVSGGSGASGSTSATGINITSTSDNLANTAARGNSFRLWFYNCANTASYKHATWEFTGQCSAPQGLVGSGSYLTAASAVDGFRFLMSSGNISTGTFKLYGIRSA